MRRTWRSGFVRYPRSIGRRTVSPDTFAASSSCGPTSCLPPPGLAVQLGNTLPQPALGQVGGVRVPLRNIVAARRGPCTARLARLGQTSSAACCKDAVDEAVRA